MYERGNEMKIYLAGPLFSMAERDYNTKIAIEITKKIPKSEVILPQNFLNIISVNENDFFKKMFDLCISSIDKSDIIIAILDGSDVDSGTCIELGYAYANKKPIIGVRTDFRSLEDNGVNLMVSKVCSDYLLLTNIEEISHKKVIDRIIKSIENLG